MFSFKVWGLRDYGVPGQIGLEPHPKQWIDKMVWVSRELRRVLKPTGSYWLNVGDTYCSTGGEQVVQTKRASYGLGGVKQPNRAHNFKDSSWLQPKQKLLMPHRLAIALQDDGWILRNDCVWYKPSHMPSSVRDRLTNSFEFVFHFVKSKKYFYDLDAIREPHQQVSLDRIKKPWNGVRPPMASWSGMQIEKMCAEGGKNPGDVWSINPAPYPEAHFACFPPALVERPLKATCPRQVCVKCGKPRERITKPTEEYAKYLGKSWHDHSVDLNEGQHKDDTKGHRTTASFETVGFSDCGCNAGWQPGVVLDPFVGSGTTLAVAQKMGLRGIGIELNADYIPLIKKRLLGHPNQTSLNPTKIKVITQEEIGQKPIM